MKHEYPERICLYCHKPFPPIHHRAGLCSPECIKAQKRAKWKVNAADLRARKKTGEYIAKPVKGEGVSRSSVDAWKKYFAKNPNHLWTMYPGRNLAGAVMDMVRIGAL